MSHATHLRLNTSLLAAPEKRLLIWIAGRLPRWIHSDHLSALGLAAMAGAGAAFWLSGSHPVAGAAPVTRLAGRDALRLFRDPVVRSPGVS